MITAIEQTGDASRSRARALWLVIAACAVVALVAFWRHAAGYFFLFDDFALVSVAKAQPFTSLFTQNFIGFYRPLGFVVLWIGARLFAWDTPGGYAALSLALHALAAVCVFGFARTLARDRLTSALAALLFLLSPWSTEAFLWVSSVYDVLATCGVLGSLWCLRLLSATSQARARVLLALGASVCALIAFFGKESAIVLPVLALIWGMGERPSARRAVWVAACLGVPAALYLVVRASMMGSVSTGAYGEFGSLWRGADVPSNVATYVRMMVWPPQPTEWSIGAVLFRVAFAYPFLAAVAPAALVRAIVERPAFIAACVVSFLVAVAPVAWFGLALNNTFSGRFAYLAGVWFALAAADALGGLVGNARVRTVVAAAALTIACGYYAGALVYQVRLWGTAAAVSRSVMRQVEAYRGQTGRALFVTNLPNMSTQGPLLLKAYAFRLYRDGKDMPPVRADITLISLSDREGGGVRAVIPLGRDIFSEYQPDGRPEVPVTIALTP